MITRGISFNKRRKFEISSIYRSIETIVRHLFETLRRVSVVFTVDTHFSTIARNSPINWNDACLWKRRLEDKLLFKNDTLI